MIEPKTPAALTAHAAGYFVAPSHARALNENLHKEIGLWELLNRGTEKIDSLYLKVSRVDLDSDASHLPGDATSQGDTTLHVNANTVPFFVLPIHWGHGINIGDYGVMWCDECTVDGEHYAAAWTGLIMGDRGPAADSLNPALRKIGEMSLEATRRMGKERVKPSGRVQDVSFDAPCRVLFWGGSGDGKAKTAAQIDAWVAVKLASLGVSIQ